MDLTWTKTTIGNVYSFTSKPRNIKTSGTIAFIPMEAILDKGEMINKAQIKMVSEVASGTYIENGDFILAKITPSFENGKQAIVSIDDAYAYASTEVIPIKEINEISDKWYLAYWLRQKEIRSYLAGKMEGTTGRQRLSKTVLSSTEIYLPPLDIQKQIVITLSEIQNAISSNEELLFGLQDLKRSMLRHLFTKGVKKEETKLTDIGEIPESWKVNKISDLVTITSGGTPSRWKEEYWRDGSIPWVKTTEINYCVIKITEEKISEIGLKNSSAKVFPKGTLLMAMYGQGVTRGRVGLLGIDASTNQACAAFLGEAKINKYLYHYLTYRYDEVRQLGHGANQKNLNAALIKSIYVPIPDSEEMEAIVNTLDLIDHKTNLIFEKLSNYQEVFKTLLHELMSGLRKVN